MDKILEESRCLADVFTPTAMELRTLLRDKCYSLILEETNNQTVFRMEDLLWKKVYHSIVTLFKKFKKDGITSREQKLLGSHLYSGIGFYSNLIDTLKKELNNPLCKVSDAHREKGMQIIHRSMIFEGDLYRYLEDTGSARCFNQAMFWYQRAILWDATNGQPHNQLGTISVSSNYGLHAVYHYLRW